MSKKDALTPASNEKEIIEKVMVDFGSNYNDEEKNILNENIHLRRTIVKNKIETDGLPTSPRDMEVIDKLLSSIDNSIQTAVSQRIASDANTNNMADLAAAIMEKVMFKRNEEVNSNNKLLELPDDIATDDVILDTELIRGKDTLDPKEFIITKDDEDEE